MNVTTNFRIKRMSVQFTVTDIGRSIDFYTKVLGFNLEFRYEDFYCGVGNEGCSIHLKSGTPWAEARSGKMENENLDVIFSVKDIDVLYHELSGKDLVITQPLRGMPYGREFYIADPDGYLIGFIDSV